MKNIYKINQVYASICKVFDMCCQTGTGGVKPVFKDKFNTGVRDIREFEKELLNTWNEDAYKANQQKTKECVAKIVEIIKNK